jgi:ERCC4-type nuclease
MHLVVDTRELSTIPFFQESFKYHFTVKKIDVGDYLIYDEDKIIAIIERKTWADLSDTITGTRANNHEKIVTSKNQLGCMVFYLIEGNMPSNRKSHCAGGKSLTFEHLTTHLDHLMMNYNFFVIHSSCYKDSVERIELLIKNFISNKLKTKIDITNNWEVTEGGENELPQFNKNLDLILRDMITACSGISLNLYEVFKPKLYDLLSGTLDIAKMKYNSGKTIGAKKANMIKKNINGVKIIGAIKSISKATAEEILKFFPLNVILNLEDKDKFLEFTINGKKQTKKMQLILDLFEMIRATRDAGPVA